MEKESGGFFMRKFSPDFSENVSILDTDLNVSENFDIIKRELIISNHKLVMYYIDGFVTASIMQKLMMHMVTIKVHLIQ